MNTIQNGTKFQAVYADGNPEWVVVAKAGRNAYKCQVTDDADWGGVVKLFSSEEINRSIAWSKAFSQARSQSDSFYETAKLGSVVHYHNGFKEYVRCIVEMGVTVHSEGKKVKCLKPIALVGDWNEWDLPHHCADGSIEMGYHAEQIQEGSHFQPSAGCIFEAPEFSNHRLEIKDPSTLPAIELCVPPLDEAQQRVAEKVKLRYAIINVLQETTDVDAALRLAKSMLENT